eukprot:m.127350 g.127350  ORF g.127350 m.127350 type:complete len:408 (+) comp29267_c0_seq3:662-1885(+)
MQSPPKGGTTPVRRRGKILTNDIDDVIYPSPPSSAERSDIIARKHSISPLKRRSPAKRRDHTPEDRKGSVDDGNAFDTPPRSDDNEDHSVKRSLAYPDDNRAPSTEGIIGSPLNLIASQLQSDFNETVDEAAERLQALAVMLHRSEAGEIVASGVVPPLIRALLRVDAPEEELAALQNLGAARDPSGAIKSHMVECGVIPAIIPFVDTKLRRPSSVKLAVAVVLNLCIDSDVRKNMMVHAGLVPKLAAILRSNDASLVCTTINALTSLSIGSEKRKAMIEANGCLESAVELLAHKEMHITLELLGFLQSLVYCNDDRKRRIMSLGFIQTLSLVLIDPQCHPQVKDVGTRLLKGLAGFSAQESRKAPTTSVCHTTPSTEETPEINTLTEGTIYAICNAGSWARSAIFG